MKVQPRRGIGRVVGCLAAWAVGCAAVLFGGGCAIGPRVVDLMPVVRLEPVEPGEFRAAPAILSGFETSGARGGWRSGDRLLVGLVSSQGSKRKVRYILLELTPVAGPLTVMRMGTTGGRDSVAPIMTTRGVAITVFDASGKEVERFLAWAPDGLLDRGPFDLFEFMAAAVRAPAGDPPPPEVVWSSEEGRRAMLGLATMSSMGRSAQASRSLLGVAREVFTFGQQFTALTQGLTVRIEERQVLYQEGRLRPAYRVPIEVRVGAHIALRAVVQADRPDAPLGLAGGVVAVDAVNTVDPSRRLHLRVLAASRGGGAAGAREQPVADSPESPT